MWSMSGSREFFMSHGISTRSEPIPLVKKRKETSSLSWTSVQTRKNPTPPHSGCPFSFPVFWGKSSPWKPKLAKFIQISQLVVLGTCSSYRFSAGLVEQRSPTKGFGRGEQSEKDSSSPLNTSEPTGRGGVTHALSENFQSSSFIPGQIIQHWTTRNCGSCKWKVA